MNQFRASCISSAMASAQAPGTMRPRTAPAPQPMISPALRPASSHNSHTNSNTNTSTTSIELASSPPTYQLNLPRTRITSPQQISSIFPIQPQPVRVNLPSPQMGLLPNAQP